jgi:hypothetical protein
MMRLTQSTEVGTAEPPTARPVLELAEPRPNPFQRSLTIAWQAPAPGNYRLALYDATGRRVATLVDGFQPAGRHAARWTSGEATPATGLLFARLTQAATGLTLTRKLVKLD